MSSTTDLVSNAVNIHSSVNTIRTGNITEGKESHGVTESGRENHGCCDRCKSSCFVFCTPCLRSRNPLPENPKIFDRFKHMFMLPPRGLFATAVSCGVLATLVWACAYTITNRDGLPGGNLFGIIVTTIFAKLFGWIVEKCRLPPLTGMLLVGVGLRNIPRIDIARHIIPAWSSALRAIALAIIMTKAGLGLDAQKLLKLSLAVVRLAFLPCFFEACVAAVTSRFLLNLHWAFAFSLGFIIAAVSPAVVVPGILNLQARRFGVAKGIPTLILASASLDDVLAITGFGMAQRIAFGSQAVPDNGTDCQTGTPRHLTTDFQSMFYSAVPMSSGGASAGAIGLRVVEGVVEIFFGIAIGVVFGSFCWYFPSKKIRHLGLFRLVLLTIAGIFFTFLARRIHLSSAGPLACLVCAFVAATGWRRESGKESKEAIAQVQEGTGLLWNVILQPVLFALVGAEIQLNLLQARTVGLGIAVLAICIAVRLLVAFLSTFGTDLNMKEKIFTAVAWAPKATVQAAFGAITLERARSRGSSVECRMGRQILNISVLVILLTAPVGAALISLFGPRLLTKAPQEGDTVHESQIDTEKSNDENLGRKESDMNTKL